MKILLVEDDPAQRGLISEMLMASGNEVIEAGSGEGAISALARADSLDLVLMDLRLPGMGGKEALDRIRALPGWRGQVPVKAISARPLSPVEDAAFDGFLPKGGDIGALLAGLVRTARLSDDVRTARLSDDVTETMARAAKPNAFAAWTNAFAAWMRTEWGWMAGFGTMLATVVGILLTNAAANARFELRLSQVEAAIERGDKRGTEAATQLSHGTSAFAELRYRLAENEAAARRTDAHNSDSFAMFAKQIGESNARNDAIEQRYAELRHVRDVEYAAMLQRIAVLEAQLHFLADRTPVPKPLGTH